MKATSEPACCSMVGKKGSRFGGGSPGAALIVRCLAVTLALALGAGFSRQAAAQGAFPAPLPNQGMQLNDPAFPPVNGAAPSPSLGGPPSSPFPSNGASPLMGGGAAPAAPQAGATDQCMKEFMPLREEAERRGKLIKVASDKHAPPEEACKLIGSFAQAEIKMIKYIEAHQAKCGIPAQIADQLRNGHKGTETLQKKVCAVAQQVQQRGPAGPSLSEVLGSAASVPEASPVKKGGSTFDTLNGNVLSR